MILYLLYIALVLAGLRFGVLCFLLFRVLLLLSLRRACSWFPAVVFMFSTLQSFVGGG